jgi:hypothetical protein
VSAYFYQAARPPEEKKETKTKTPVLKKKTHTHKK